jgi:hypothetical protein
VERDGEVKCGWVEIVEGEGTRSAARARSCRIGGKEAQPSVQFHSRETTSNELRAEIWDPYQAEERSEL